ncbi:hypothetical protein MMC10_007484 [Thelotrema lepadinum]|nr:hypothetical protein [Thelotrema lepadinum]
MGLFDVIIMAARVAQFVFAVIVLGTASYVASLWANGGITDAFGNSFDFHFVPSQIAFMIFVSLWSILVVLWQVLTPRFAQGLAHRFVILGLDALTMLFWFAGFIALAVATGAFIGVTLSWYQTQQACVAFGAFSWIAFLITTVLSAIDVFRGRGAKHNPELNNAA